MPTSPPSSLEEKPVIVIAGPTASGKSALAVDIAERFSGVVINADSMQVYCGLEVLSSSPEEAMKSRAPHRLYGVLDPAEVCSAGKWRDMAMEEIERAHGEALLPIVVGGTGLYLRTLMSGIARMPAIPGDVREHVRALMTTRGSQAMHRELRRRDPEMAARLEPGDRQRIARAIEILESTGQTMTAWQRGGEVSLAPAGLRFFTLLIMPPRDELYADCDRRFVEMLETGALEEARLLGERNLDPALPAMKALGVPDLLRHLSGEISREVACAQGQQATRRYAKRQVTWFRRQIVANLSISTKYNEKYKDKFFSDISTFLLTCSG